MGKVGHLSRLQDEYADRGFRVVALSSEDQSTLRKMVADRKPTYWIGCDPQDETMPNFTRFGVVGIPRFYLVNAFGEVVSNEIPSEEELEKLLEDAFDPTLPQLHEGLEEAVAAFAWRDHGDAHRTAQALVKHKDQALAADAVRMVEHIDRLAAYRRKELEHERAKYGLRDAVLFGRLLCMELELKGHELADWAASERKQLAKSDAVKKEKRAWKKLETAIGRELTGRTRAHDLKRAGQLYEEIQEKYRYSEAAKIAAVRAKRGARSAR